MTPMALSMDEGTQEILVVFAMVVVAAVLLFATIRVVERADERMRGRSRLDPDLPEHVYRLRLAQRVAHVPAALSADVWPRLAEFLSVGDKYGVAEMVEAGQVALLPPETMVRRIKVEGPLAEIRIEDGEYIGALAWTLASSLTRDRA